jgi:hypothetical protein
MFMKFTIIEGLTSFFQFWSACLLFFICTVMELCITNSFPRVKLWTNISIQIFSNIYKKMCSKNNPRNGSLKIGFSTMTMLPLTLLCLCRNFWPRMAQLLLCTLLTPQICHPPTFFKTQVSTDRKKTWWHIMILKQLQAILAEFKTKDLCIYFQQWCRHWAHCIKLQRNYFERDSME